MLSRRIAAIALAAFVLIGAGALTGCTPQYAVVDAAKKAGRTSVLLGVFRNGRTAFLPVKISG